MNKQNYTDYVAAVYRHNPQADPHTVDRLHSIAGSLHRLSEQQCNGFSNQRGDWDEAAEKRADKREERLTAEATKLAAELGAKLYVQGDPRGWPLYLFWPDDPGYDNPDSWHGEGIPPR